MAMTPHQAVRLWNAISEGPGIKPVELGVELLSEWDHCPRIHLIAGPDLSKAKEVSAFLANWSYQINLYVQEVEVATKKAAAKAKRANAAPADPTMADRINESQRLIENGLQHTRPNTMGALAGIDP